jgi:4-amino-4-deoxy-L-arabinose transferase-like glycosyltransferase
MNVTVAPESIQAPARQRSALWSSYLVFTLCASLYLLPFMRLIQQRTDEGIFLSGAMRIVHGQVFARDFFEMMGPGSFYWLAWFYKLFGVTFLATRISLFITSLGTCLTIYILSRRIGCRHPFIPCVCVLATYYGSIWPGISHHVDSNFIVLLSVVSIVQWHERGSKLYLLVAGVLAGAATCTFLHKGVLLFCALLVWLWIQQRWSRAFRSSFVLLGAGYFSAVGVMLAYFWSQGALDRLVYVNLVWPLQHYESVNIVPYAHGIVHTWVQLAWSGGSLSWLVVLGTILIVPYLFVAALPFLLTGLAIVFRARTVTPLTLLFWLCGGALLLSEMQRKDITHLAFGSPLLVILTIYFLGEARNRIASSTLQIVAITSVVLAGMNFMFALTARPVATRVGEVAMFRQDPVLTALDANVAAGEELFVYPYCPSYYFLSNTINPTRYSVLYNGNTLSQFAEVISLLDRQKVKHVLWYTRFETETIPENFPGAPRMTPGRLLIESYLESHYKTATEADGFRVMERKGDDLAK